MLSTLSAVFQKKSFIESYENQFEIHNIIWFLKNRIKEFVIYQMRGQLSEIYRRLKFNEEVKIYSEFLKMKFLFLLF
jgi:hypothetical protein